MECDVLGNLSGSWTSLERREWDLFESSNARASRLGDRRALARSLDQLSETVCGRNLTRPVERSQPFGRRAKSAASAESSFCASCVRSSLEPWNLRTPATQRRCTLIYSRFSRIETWRTRERFRFQIPRFETHLESAQTCTRAEGLQVGFPSRDSRDRTLLESLERPVSPPLFARTDET